MVRSRRRGGAGAPARHLDHLPRRPPRRHCRRAPTPTWRAGWRARSRRPPARLRETEAPAARSAANWRRRTGDPARACVMRLRRSASSRPWSAAEASFSCRLGNCPYRDSVRENQPVVCGLHRGITEGMLTELDPRRRWTSSSPTTPTAPAAWSSSARRSSADVAKRAAALRPLSREHLGALLCAKRMREEEDAAAAAATFLEFWEKDGRRHFRIEEEVLLPGWALHAEVDREGVARMLDEHLAIRREALRLAAGVSSLDRVRSARRAAPRPRPLRGAPALPPDRAGPRRARPPGAGGGDRGSRGERLIVFTRVV